MDAWGEVERAMGKVVAAAREQGWVRELERIRWREDQAWFWAQVAEAALCICWEHSEWLPYREAVREWMEQSDGGVVRS